MIKINLSKDTEELIYKTLNALEKTPKVENVDESLKELIKQELLYTKAKHNFKCQSSYNNHHLIDDTNITDRLVNSYIGVVLKQVRIEKRKTAFLNKRIPFKANKNTVMRYYNMNEWEIVKCASKSISCGYSRRSTVDIIKRDFTRAVIDFKELTIEAAAESVIKNHTEQLKDELFKYIDNNFK